MRSDRRTVWQRSDAETSGRLPALMNQGCPIGRRAPGNDHGVDDQWLITGFDDHDLMRPRNDLEVLVIAVEVLHSTGVDAINEYACPPRLDVQLHAASGSILKNQRPIH